MLDGLSLVEGLALNCNCQNTHTRILQQIINLRLVNSQVGIRKSSKPKAQPQCKWFELRFIHVASIHITS